VTFGQRFARVVTNIVVRRPMLWRLFRGVLRRVFDRLAPTWDARRKPDSFAPVEAALDRLPTAPRRVLDLGTGTGSVARIVAARFPDADVVGVDFSQGMLDEARRRTDSPRVTYEHADAERLPFEDASFDLVTLANMIPFFDELARVVAPGGHIVVAFSAGPETPIYVPQERLRGELELRGFMEFADVSAGRGTGFLAVKS
jgi:ubiquinone/menaquinone biosynthesis C-methylase UbiE